MPVRYAIASLMFVAALLGGCRAADYGPDQNGRTVAARELDSHWLVVNYWAEWCGPCRTEIPELNALANDSKGIKGQGVRVLGVNYDGLRGDDLKKASSDLGITFTVLADDPAARFALERSEALPATFIIDGKGKVRERLLGEQTAAGIKAKLVALQALP
ncbi:TlpA disulfide reductase family protein [Pseudomonas sp. nanlin1]|uniref:TlpA disulfide reductase family protein n=1 Tax=Pseudomonas sp. nanlin1 TaxID=3040605 RepID=UPI00388EE979